MDDPAGLFRPAVALLMLVGAAASDLRTRRVSNDYWLPFLAIGLALVLGDVAAYNARIVLVLPYALAIATAAAAYGLWWTGVVLGGADAKGLIVLAVLVPWHITQAAWTLTPTVDTFVNAILLVPLFPLAYLGVNLVRGRWAGVATFLATPMPLARARAAHVWPLERVVAGRVVRRYKQRLHQDMDDVYAQLEAAGVERVWATPKLPFVALLAVGFALAWWQGNLMLVLVDAVLS